MATVLYNIGTLVHFSHAKDEDGGIDSEMAIVIEGDEIVKIQSSSEVTQEYGVNDHNDHQFIDVKGRAVIPGLVDSHAHLLWAGDRSQEVAWRQEGHTYLDIANMGGGIASTVAATRKATEHQLLGLGLERLERARRTGTTHMEVKSGYGLDTVNELKLLSAADRLQPVSYTHLTLPTILRV